MLKAFPPDFSSICRILLVHLFLTWFFLRSMLYCDIVGFHSYDFARHFVSSCKRVLQLFPKTSSGTITFHYQVSRTFFAHVLAPCLRFLSIASLALFDFQERQVQVRIMHGGVDTEALRIVANSPEVAHKLTELRLRWGLASPLSPGGRRLLTGVSDLDEVHGALLKLQVGFFFPFCLGVAVNRIYCLHFASPYLSLVLYLCLSS